MKFLSCLWLLLPLLVFAQRKGEDNLEMTLARARKALVKSVHYDLEFNFKKMAKGITAKEVMSLELNSVPKSDLSVDSLGQKIKSLSINGKVVKAFKQRKGSFDLPAKSLGLENKIEVIYEAAYSDDSSGLIRAQDPEDKAEYIYTDFEPYYAHRLFPCFDQPDLKATYLVTVTAPKEWKVIHNDLIVSETSEGEFKKTIFNKTPKISPYLFFLGVGPFVEWSDEFDGLPLTLYARQSIAKYVDHENILKTTKRGLAFFNSYFGYKYPFAKYGQVFIPEFAWGGMENPGAVTLNERNIFRGPVPSAKIEDRDNLILHEMAHMWFGDLVTMQWWNDLWLNESFATYLASIAQERSLDSKWTWLDFFSTKAWGYWQDQLVTTHPIETLVPDTRTAKGNFDGITYAKGASSLKQLHYFVGEMGFEQGLKKYFQKYAFQNTERADFINAIADASGKNLDQWTKQWLQTAGPNRVGVKVTCKDGDVETFDVVQKPSVSGTLSPHRMRLGLYEVEDDEFDDMRSSEVTYSEALTAVDLKGKTCPDFIMPNDGDFDYALFELDESSSKHVDRALVELPDSLSRFMLWTMLFQEVRDGKRQPVSMMKLAIKALVVEKDEFLLGLLLGNHSSLRDQFGLYLTKAQRAELVPGLEKVLWDRVLNEKKGTSLQMSFFDFYLTIVQTPEAQGKVLEMLTKKTGPEGITLDQDRRWALLLALARTGYPDALKLVEAELKTDSSTQGKKMAFAAKASFPSAETKAQVWKTFLTDKNLAYSYFKEGAGRFNSGNYPDLASKYLKAYFDKVKRTDWRAEEGVVDVYFEYLFPFALCSKEVSDLSRRSMKEARHLTSLAKRSWLEAQDELDRCVRVRQ